MKTLKLTRPEPLEVTLSDGRVIVIEPATRAGIRAAIELDPPDPDGIETPADKKARLALQLAALIGPTLILVITEAGTTREEIVAAEPILATLTPHEENTLLWALWAQATGFSPELAATLSSKKKLLAGILAVANARPESNDSTPTPPPSPITSTAV